MQGRVTDGAALRDQNVALVLSEIRREGAAARVTIAEATGLSPATVTTVTAELLARGLIEEVEGAREGTGRGRPAVRLRLTPDALYVAGAKLSDQQLTVVILNFAGDVVGEGAAEMPAPQITLEAMAPLLDQALSRALAVGGLSEDDIAAIGLGVPGYVDAAARVCLWSPVLLSVDAKAIDLGAALDARFACPTFVDNDANLATLAELWFGLGKGRTDFLVVTIEHGLGLGVVLDGRLFRGARGVGAEFGHTKVQPDGALCRCGQRGCVEAYVADYALIRESRTALGHMNAAASVDDLLSRLFERAREGDKAAMSIFQRAGRMLGLGLANLINIFDPPLLIISGERLRYEQFFSDETLTTLRANSLATSRPAPEIRVNRWGDQLWARGAGALALEGLNPAPRG